jgi:hypothetical protein
MNSVMEIGRQYFVPKNGVKLGSTKEEILEQITKL